jgi:hypothetical protein
VENSLVCAANKTRALLVRRGTEIGVDDAAPMPERAVPGTVCDRDEQVGPDDVGTVGARLASPCGTSRADAQVTHEPNYWVRKAGERGRRVARHFDPRTDRVIFNASDAYRTSRQTKRTSTQPHQRTQAQQQPNTAPRHTQPHSASSHTSAPRHSTAAQAQHRHSAQPGTQSANSGPGTAQPHKRTQAQHTAHTANFIHCVRD